MKIFFPHCAFESCLLRAIFIFCKSGAKLMFFPTVPPLFVQIDLAPTILLDVHFTMYITSKKSVFQICWKFQFMNAQSKAMQNIQQAKKIASIMYGFFSQEISSVLKDVTILVQPSVLPTTLLAIIVQVGNTGRHFRFQTNLFSPK